VETSLPFFNEAINNLIVDLEYFLLLFSSSIITILSGKSTRTGIFSSQSNIYYFKKFFDFVFCFCISLFLFDIILLVDNSIFIILSFLV